MEISKSKELLNVFNGKVFELAGGIAASNNEYYAEEYECAKTMAESLELKVELSGKGEAPLISFKSNGRRISLFVDSWGEENSLEDAVIYELCNVIAGKINGQRINHYFGQLIERSMKISMNEVSVGLFGGDNKLEEDDYHDINVNTIDFLIDTYASFYYINVAAIEVAKELVKGLDF